MMNLEISPKAQAYRDKLLKFVEEKIEPAKAGIVSQLNFN